MKNRVTPPTDKQVSSVLDHATGFFDRTTALRREIHQWPELGNALPKTRDAVLANIEDLPLDITLHDSTTGVVALLEGDHPGPTILLRGDMDALEMPDNTGLEFESRVDGSMHACGHDAHTAMLATAARVLSERTNELHGRVAFMFQPGEEGHHGARFMLDEGLLDVPARKSGEASPIDAAFAIHITSTMPTGWFASKGGPIMASADTFRVHVIGEGGHASEPFRAVDPIPVACEIVQALNTMVTRTINVFDPGVVTVGRITAGTTNNVIPESADIEGTIRATSEATRRAIHDNIKRVANGVADAHGCEVSVNLDIGYPVTTNDDRFADFSLDLAGEVAAASGGKSVRLPNPVMGAEDFSYVLDELPGSMVFLGATPHDHDLSKAAPNHSNRVHFEESAMVSGVSMYAMAALRHLAPA